MAPADENKQKSSPGLTHDKFPSRIGGVWSQKYRSGYAVIVEETTGANSIPWLTKSHPIAW
jgi:hypothetical protein